MRLLVAQLAIVTSLTFGSIAYAQDCDSNAGEALGLATLGLATAGTNLGMSVANGSNVAAQAANLMAVATANLANCPEAAGLPSFAAQGMITILPSVQGPKIPSCTSLVPGAGAAAALAINGAIASYDAAVAADQSVLGVSGSKGQTLLDIAVLGGTAAMALQTLMTKKACENQSGAAGAKPDLTATATDPSAPYALETPTPYEPGKDPPMKKFCQEKKLEACGCEGRNANNIVCNAQAYKDFLENTLPTLKEQLASLEGPEAAAAAKSIADFEAFDAALQDSGSGDMAKLGDIAKGATADKKGAGGAGATWGKGGDPKGGKFAGPADRTGLGGAYISGLGLIDSETGRELDLFKRATRRYQGVTQANPAGNFARSFFLAKMENFRRQAKTIADNIRKEDAAKKRGVASVAPAENSRLRKPAGLTPPPPLSLIHR